MAKKPRPRTERRAEDRGARRDALDAERAQRSLIRDREALFARSPGGTEALPLDVPAASVIEVRAASRPCPQCAGELRVESHLATRSGDRAVAVRCTRCGVARTLYFRVAGFGAN